MTETKTSDDADRRTGDSPTSEPDRAVGHRREFLRALGSAGALTGLGTVGSGRVRAQSAGDGPSHGNHLAEDPFTLGVASGDPLSDSVVLWTRLAPDPLAADGGMDDRQVPVNWKVATDEEMCDVVASGAARARPEHAHSVHVEPTGLEPDTEYCYQFRVGKWTSTVGTTQTAPEPGAAVSEFAFAFASCQNYPRGFYTAYEHLAEEDLDLVVHLGDYIYEGGERGPFDREHEPPKTLESLSDYRIRHAQYKTDPNLQAAHAAFPWLVTWDDHEVANNYADELSEADAPPEEFLARRANAYKAYWEHQPLRRSRLPDGPHLPLYRRFTFGDLAEFNVLDTRQYRDDQVYSPEEADDADRTLLGDEQESWLLDGLGRSASNWNVLAQQVPFAATDETPDPSDVDFGGGDKWDGYRADRETLLEFMTQHADSLNPVVITGDVHQNYVYDLKADFSDPTTETVGTEYVGTSISSFGDGSGARRYGPTPNEPWRRFHDDERGYVRCRLTDDRWQTDYRVVSTVEEPSASISTVASFVTESGDPGAKQITPSVEFDLPDAYDSGAADEPPEPFDATVTVTNGDHSYSKAVTVEDVRLRVENLPDGWTSTADTETQFDSIANGESVAATWTVTPDSTAEGDVALEFEVAYGIGDDQYRYLEERTMSAVQIAYWRFENDTADSSSYDHPVSLENGASFDDQVAVEGEYSVRLDGDDDYVDLAEGGDEFLSQSFTERTVSMWIKPDSPAGDRVLYNEGAAVNGMGLRLTDGKLQAAVVSGGDTATVESPFDTTDWTHVAVVFDHGAFRLFQNGTEVAGTEDVGYESASGGFWGGELGTAEVFLGGWSGNFGGHVDATAIYNRALSAEQLSTLSSAPSSNR